MIKKLKRILSGMAGEIAKGMIYGNAVNCNGGSVVIGGALN